MKKLLIIFTILSSLFTACVDHVDDHAVSNTPNMNNKQEEKELRDGYVVAPNAYAIKCTDFIDERANVTHSADTTFVEINNQLLAKLNIKELKQGDVLDIWEDVKYPPYIRVVENATDLGNGNTRVATHAGDISMLFDKADLNLNTGLYCDDSKTPSRNFSRAIDGVLPETELVDTETDGLQFRQGNTIHPMVIYRLDKDTKEYKHELSEKVIAQSPASRGSASFRLINIKTGLDWTPTKPSDGLSIYVKHGEFKATADVNVSLKFGFFKVKEFKTYLTGNIDLTAPLNVKCNITQKYEMTPKTLCEFEPYVSVFAIGPFPVPVLIQHGIVFKADAMFCAGVGVTFPIEYHSNFNIGPKYSNGNWEKGIQYSQHYNIKPENIMLGPSIHAESTVGVYYHVGVYIGPIGPFIEVGPQFRAKFSAGTSLENKVKVASRGAISFGGAFGGEIKLWKFNLGSIKMPFELSAIELWNWEKQFDATKDFTQTPFATSMAKDLPSL